MMGWMILLLYFTVRSDIAKVYPPGQEKAIGNQTGGLPYPAGQEKAHAGNANLAHNYGDIDK